MQLRSAPAAGGGDRASGGCACVGAVAAPERRTPAGGVAPG
jgi:hypothetical protein